MQSVKALSSSCSFFPNGSGSTLQLASDTELHCISINKDVS